MATPRDRRLGFELERMKKVVLENPSISFIAQGGQPVEYGVILRCRGIEAIDGDKKIYRDEHRLIIKLGPEFPLDAPLIYWETPLFHPNVVPPAVCMGDHWYPGGSVAELCLALCEMVQYRSFNIYDPLNRDAAQWIEKRIEIGDIISVDKADDADETNFELNPVQRS